MNFGKVGCQCLRKGYYLWGEVNNQKINGVFIWKVGSGKITDRNLQENHQKDFAA